MTIVVNVASRLLCASYNIHMSLSQTRGQADTLPCLRRCRDDGTQTDGADELIKIPAGGVIYAGILLEGRPGVGEKTVAKVAGESTLSV